MDSKKELYQKSAMRGSRAAELMESDSWNKDIKPALERRLDSYLLSLRSGLDHEKYLLNLGKIAELEFLINLPETWKKSGLNAVEAMDREDA